jgi:hypothetical protein
LIVKHQSNQYPKERPTNPKKTNYPIPKRKTKVQYQSTSFFQSLEITKPILEKPGVRCPDEKALKATRLTPYKKLIPSKRGDFFYQLPNLSFEEI